MPLLNKIQKSFQSQPAQSGFLKVYKQYTNTSKEELIKKQIEKESLKIIQEVSKKAEEIATVIIEKIFRKETENIKKEIFDEIKKNQSFVDIFSSKIKMIEGTGIKVSIKVPLSKTYFKQ